MARVVHKEDDVRAPELDVLWLQSKKVLADLMIDEVLRDITPFLGRTEIVDQQEHEDQDTYGSRRVRLFDEEHGEGGHDAAEKSRLPTEELEARTEVWR